MHRERGLQMLTSVSYSLNIEVTWFVVFVRQERVHVKAQPKTRSPSRVMRSRVKLWVLEDQSHDNMIRGAYTEI